MCSATFRPPCYPFDHVFFPSFLPKLYSSLPKSRQRVITRFCPTSPTVEATQRSHTTLLTTFLHSTNCKNFCRGPPPQQQVSTTYEFRSCKRKLLNTLAAPFCRFAAHQKSQKPQQITIAVHNPRSQHTAKGAQPHKS